MTCRRKSSSGRSSGKDTVLLVKRGAFKEGGF
jgi:hypothetical protein